MKKTFDTNKEPLPPMVQFYLNVPIPAYAYVKELIVIKMKEGIFSTTFRSFFLEGFEILKQKNPLIKGDESFEKRKYPGGEQKSKTKTHETNVSLPAEDINWINAYIHYKREENILFSNRDFINDLINELKEKYSEGGSIN